MKLCRGWGLFKTISHWIVALTLVFQRAEFIELKGTSISCPSSAEIIKFMGLFSVWKNRAAKKTLWSKGCLQRPDRKGKSLPPGGSKGRVSQAVGNGATGTSLCPSLPRACADFPLSHQTLIHADGQIAELPVPFPCSPRCRLVG